MEDINSIKVIMRVYLNLNSIRVASLPLFCSIQIQPEPEIKLNMFLQSEQKMSLWFLLKSNLFLIHIIHKV